MEAKSSERHAGVIVEERDEAKWGTPCNGQSKRGQAASSPKTFPADGANMSFAVDWMDNVLVD